MSIERFRKPRPAQRPDKDPFSTAFRRARNLICAGDFADALAALNTLAATTSDPLRQSRVVSMVADCQFAQGDFDGALSSCRQAGTAAADDPRAWLRPALSEVRTLIAQVQTDAAKLRANQIVQTAVNLEAASAAQLAAASALLVNQGAVTVAPRPYRPSVVATRLGGVFFSGGETDTAESLFQNALSIEPAGASLAHLGLARIALQSGDAAGALQHATAALTIGNFGAKTIAAWPVVCTALRMQTSASLDPALLAGLQTASPSVAARATLMLSKTLRESGGTGWQTMASGWLAASANSSPAVAAELRKLLLASQRLTGSSPATRGQIASALLATPGLSPSEFLAASKEQVRSAILSGQDPGFAAVIAQGIAAHGSFLAPALRNGLAVACHAAGRGDLAATLFQQNVDTAQSGDPAWGKALWNLARIQKENGNFAAAAAYLSQYLAAANLPVRMRLYTQIEWARCIYLSGQPDLVASIQPRLAAMVNSITDFELALDTARQLTLAPAALQPLCLKFKNRGEDLARTAFQAALHPDAAASVLFKLARRQADFGEFAATAAQWNALDAKSRDWLWSVSSNFWNYLGFVFTAFKSTGDSASLENLADTYLNDPATPPLGIVQLGIRYGAYKVQSGDFAAAMPLFRSIVAQSPGNPYTGYAWYWIALSQWKSGAQTAAASSAQSLLLALGNNPGLDWEKELTLRGQLIVNNLVSPDSSNAAFDAALSQIQTDLQAPAL